MAFWTKAAINIVKKQRAAGELTWEQQRAAINAIQAAVRVNPVKPVPSSHPSPSGQEPASPHFTPPQQEPSMNKIEHESDMIHLALNDLSTQVRDDIASLRASGAVVHVSTVMGIRVELPPDIRARDLRLTGISLINTALALEDARRSN